MTTRPTAPGRATTTLGRTPVRGLAALAWLLALIAPAALDAQASARVRGTVRAQSGRPLAGVAVTDGRDTVRSDDAGRFVLRISAGVAGAVEVRTPGFLPARVAVAPLGEGSERALAIVLVPLAQLDVQRIVATRTRPLLNTADAGTGGAIERVELQSLPTNAREPLQLLTTVPGIAQATGFFGDAPRLTFAGANALATTYTLDGLENTEGFLGGPRVELPLAALARMEAFVSTAPVARGRSHAGVVDQESRTGGDAWRGELVVTHRPGVPFDARSAFVPAGTTPDDFRRAERGFVRTQLAAAGGGPLVAGRSYAFGAVEHGDENEDRVLSTARTAFLGRERRRVTKLLGRVDHGWTPTQTTTLRVAGSRTARAGEGSGIVAPEADITTIRAGALAALVHHGAWRAGRVGHELALQAAGYRWHFPPTRSDFSRPQVTILGRDSIPVGVVGSSNFVFDETERQLQLRDTWTVALGERHVLEGGVDVVSSGFRLAAAGTNPNGAYEVVDNGDIPVRADGRYAFADIPTSVTVRSYTIDAAPQQVNLRQTTGAAWLEERWRPTPSLTVRAGLRWDVDDITGRGPGRTDRSAWQPRASVNWALSPVTVVRGGAGIFAGRLPYAVYSDAIQFGPAGNRTVTFRGSEAPAFGAGPLAPQLDRATLPPGEVRELFALGLRTPRSRQLSLGWQRLLAPSLSLAVDAVAVETRELPRSWDLNATTRRIGPADTVGLPLAVGDAFRPVAPVPGGFRRRTTTASGGRARYRALHSSLRWLPASRVALDASWTWARARTDAEDINFNATQGNDFAAEWADAINDRRHHVTTRATWEGRRWSLATIADWQTGTPVNRVAFFRDLNGSGPVYGDGFIGNWQRFAGVPRNGERLPSAFLVHLSAGWRARVAGSDLRVRAEVFNLLNAVNASGYANGLPGGGSRTQVGQPGDPIVIAAAGAPRQVQLSLEWAP